jgi:glutamyl-tRNA synthetase
MSAFSDHSCVVTRFAPSPTGVLHLGSARTAYFNWLYARAKGGRFLLRIEDTDQQRSSNEMIQQILNTMNWLGLDFDQEYVLQSGRIKRHQEVAHQLVQDGKAYYCYASAQELEALRSAAALENKVYSYDRRWRNPENQEIPSNVAPCIRLKVPLSGTVVLEDQVQGPVSVQAKALDDFVLLRADQTPTYMLAVVVDDHDMGITHIIRGDDHLTNAFRQKCLYDALGWSVPIMAHIPLIHGAEGGKLSKRDGAASAEEFRSLGILPEALLNALLRLGCSHGDDEKISVAEALKWFDFGGLGKAAARFDPEKLFSLNAHYLRQKTPQEVMLILQKEYTDFQPDPVLLEIIPELQKRATTLVDLHEAIQIYHSDMTFSEIILSAEDTAKLPEILNFFTQQNSFFAEDLEPLFKAFLKEKEWSLGAIAKCLRLILTGKPVSPGLFWVLQALGKKRVLDRVSACLASKES